jgi:hypothetical protein
VEFSIWNTIIYSKTKYTIYFIYFYSKTKDVIYYVTNYLVLASFFKEYSCTNAPVLLSLINLNPSLLHIRCKKKLGYIISESLFIQFDSEDILHSLNIISLLQFRKNQNLTAFFTNRYFMLSLHLQSDHYLFERP